MAWRVANSLQTLLGQFNALAPTRNKVSDGSIGDTNHQNRTSDHNPWYGPGIVTARDFTHDPARLSMHWVADTLVAHRDPRIKYVIWNRRIWNPAAGWRAYTGANPHTSHLHLSVVASPACDSTAAWAGFIPGPPPPPEVPEVELSTSMRDYFSRPGTTWPEAIKQQDVGAVLANIFSFGNASAQNDARLIAVLTQVLEKVTNDPDITRAEIKAMMEQAIRENTPEPVPAEVDEAAIAALVVQEIGNRTDVAPETVQEIAEASAAAIAARMSS